MSIKHVMTDIYEQAAGFPPSENKFLFSTLLQARINRFEAQEFLKNRCEKWAVASRNGIGSDHDFGPVRKWQETIDE